MKPRYLVAALAVAALIVFLVLRRGGDDGATASSASGKTSVAGGEAAGPARDLPVEPALLPHGVPTRAQANAARVEPPPRPQPEESKVATPDVAAELDETVANLTERARACTTGKTAEVEVRMTFREGTAHVREAKIAGASLGDALDRCIVEQLTGHSWTVGADDKVFDMTITLKL